MTSGGPGGDEIGAQLQTLGDGGGQHVEEQPIGYLLLANELLVNAPKFMTLVNDRLSARFQFMHFPLKFLAVLQRFPVQQTHFQHIANPHQHLRQIKWLADEVFRTGLQCAQFVIRLGGDDDHRKVAVRLDFLEAFHDLEPVHAGHLQIKQDQVIVVLAVKLKHRARIGGWLDANVAGPA